MASQLLPSKSRRKSLARAELFLKEPFILIAPVRKSRCSIRIIEINEEAVKFTKI